MKLALGILALFFGIYALIWLTVGVPDGFAKSAYLKQTQGIDIPWYQATWLHVDVHGVNAKVETNK